MSEQPIELRLAVAEARIEALTAVVVAMAIRVQHPTNQQALNEMWAKMDGLEHAGVEILQAAEWELAGHPICAPVAHTDEMASIQATVTLTGKCKACGETVSPHVEFCQSCTGENES